MSYLWRGAEWTFGRHLGDALWHVAVVLLIIAGVFALLSLAARGRR